MLENVNVIKKDGTIEPFTAEKIITAVGKSADRMMIKFSDEENQKIVNNIVEEIEAKNMTSIPIVEMHKLVEASLEKINPTVCKSYRDYRNYKKEFVHMLDDVYKRSQAIRYIGDKENANSDSTLVATKRCLIFNELNKQLYNKFFLNVEEKQANADGYIYIHDQSARLDTMNCFRRDTKFITEYGVKSFYDFKDGDEVIVLSHKGNWKKAVVHSYGWQPIQKVTMKRANGKSKEIFCTNNHRWFLKDGSETTSLQIGDRLLKAPNIFDFNWDDITNKEKWLWCLGFGFADGSCILDNNMPTMHIRLCGDKTKYASRFEEIGYTVTFPESLEGDGMVRMPDVHSKELTPFLLNYANVKYFISGYLAADGNKSFSDNFEFRSVQVSGELNKYFYDLLNMSGQYVSTIYDLTGQETNYGFRRSDTFSYKVCCEQNDRTWFVEDIDAEKLNPKAQVWCLEVEDDHGFVLDGGIPTGNCCIFDMKSVLTGGFEMGNIWYNEPKTLDTAFDVMGDVILSTAAQQYGGFTVPEVDKLLAPFAEKSYKKYYDNYINIQEQTLGIIEKTVNSLDSYEKAELEQKADDFALSSVRRDFEQGWQGIEYKLNTVGSSRGDYPFIAMTFGLGTKKFEKMCSIQILHVHKKGQGEKGKEVPVLFPKWIFLYDENIHGEGCENEDVFEEAILCSSKTMYPDYLSLSGEGYVPSMYKKYGEVISPMGCRAFLSPYYERGGINPADENDKPVYVGRFNIGAISLHLPMILAKAKRESKDFYEVLDYYLNLIRGIHKKTYEYLGQMRASVNPIAYCEGGFYGGHLQPGDKIAPLLKSATASFGITALNELQELYNGKSIYEDGEFALEVMQYINDKIAEFKEEDGWLYAIYGTPAESLCFSGDTVVQTYKENKRIDEIKVGDLVYSYNEAEKRIELKPVVRSMMTNENAKVLEITFDNDQKIVCTPDHKFAKRKMVQDSKGKFVKEVIEYCKASDLKVNDRIKSNYITIDSSGHKTCSTNQHIYDINAQYFLGDKPDGFEVHHKDFNKLNDDIENLEYLSKKDHRIQHISNIEGHSFKKGDMVGSKNLFFNKKHSAHSKLLNRIKHLGKNNVGSKKVVQLDLDGNIVNVFESRGLAESATGFSNISYACNGKYLNKDNPHEYKNYLWFFEKDISDYCVENHKVKSINFLEDTIPVYDIEVADNHNFYVGGDDGILVHNCGKQIEQFRREFGIIEKVSDRSYVTNSFHCHVTEDITPIEKQDSENRFWGLLNGGKIQYCRYNLGYNIDAIRTLVRRAMKMGFYEGVNLELSYCECGNSVIDSQYKEHMVCDKCGRSDGWTKITRMNGYLAFSRQSGNKGSRLNQAKMQEVADRISM